jgi:8-oxo-dGTP pyrophosphatase MutT (NUDIX family)
VVIREFWEELGFWVNVLRLCAVIENFNAYGYDSLHEFGMYYVVEPVEQIPQDDNPFKGVEKSVDLTFRWIRVSEINQVNLYPKVLQQLLIEFPGDFRHFINSDA